jgi:carbonic anhydrase
MDSVQRLIDNNRDWARHMSAEDPDFFPRLARQQSPEYLWIGCADSRVPANEIVGLAPGELFVHRNIANVVVQSDLNCISVVQFAVDVLKVKHIIVTGHYGCGGVQAALTNKRVGIADHWISHVRSVFSRHQPLLDQAVDQGRKLDLLCELNVIEQALHVAALPTLLDAWERGQHLWVHGWCYGLNDGLVHDLGLNIGGRSDISKLRTETVIRLLQSHGVSP